MSFSPRRPCRLSAFVFIFLCVVSIASSSNAFSATSKQTKLYFDISIPTPSREEIPVGRITFHLTPPDHPDYLPLHTSNLMSLASSQRRSIDPKATYIGCNFQYSPATIEDGSFRYRWSHQCDGYGRNGIQTTSSSGAATNYDEPFTDPERLKEVCHKCGGGVYYGRRYDDILSGLANEGQDVAILLTVPIRGGSRFSIVRVNESPKEWGERLLLNSVVVGYLDCNADGRFGGDDSDANDADENSPTSLDVLRAMARQRFGPPTIVDCGVISSEI